MKRFALLLTLSVLLVFSSGCGLLVADKEGEKEKKTKEEEIDAVEPSETFKEVEFKHINWFMGAPDPEEHGGIWLYNKESIRVCWTTTIGTRKICCWFRPPLPNMTSTL